MKTKVFSVYDEKAKVYNRPFHMNNAGMAMRSFEDVLKLPEDMMHLHPSDYRLYEIGEYDDETGKFECYKEKVFLCTALDCMPQGHFPEEVEGVATVN